MKFHQHTDFAMKEYKKFEDLKFNPHPRVEGIQARMDFDNGYGISVIQGPYFYCDGPHEYEVAVFKGGHLTYGTPITDDVIGHVGSAEVTDIMRQIQDLPKAE